MRPYYLQPGDAFYHGHRLPYGVELADVEDHELTADARRAFRLPPAKAKPAILKRNLDLLPGAPAQERVA